MPILANEYSMLQVRPRGSTQRGPFLNEERVFVHKSSPANDFSGCREGLADSGPGPFGAQFHAVSVYFVSQRPDAFGWGEL